MQQSNVFCCNTATNFVAKMGNFLSCHSSSIYCNVSQSVALSQISFKCIMQKKFGLNCVQKASSTIVYIIDLVQYPKIAIQLSILSFNTLINTSLLVQCSPLYYNDIIIVTIVQQQLRRNLSDLCGRAQSCMCLLLRKCWTPTNLLPELILLQKQKNVHWR